MPPQPALTAESASETESESGPAASGVEFGCQDLGFRVLAVEKGLARRDLQGFRVWSLPLRWDEGLHTLYAESMRMLFWTVGQHITYLHACLSICLSIYLSIYLSICLSIRIYMPS